MSTSLRRTVSLVRSFLVLIILGLLTAACGGGGPFGLGAEVAKADVARVTPSVTEADIQAVVRGDRALGLDLLGLAARDGNLMLSPYSVATALSMAYAGARGRTAEEMAVVMHLDVDDDVLHQVRNAIDVDIRSAPQAQDGDTREGFVIRPTNAAWGQKGYEFADQFLEILASHYDAGIRLTDFSDSDEATNVINGWVEEATEGRIKDLVSGLDASTRLMLIQAIWFKANWADAFASQMTEPGPFSLLDGTEATVPMMHGGIKADYAQTTHFEALRLPYAGDAAMIVALPRTGTPAETVQQLEADDLDIAWQHSTIEVTMPKFEFETDLPLIDMLQALGMTAAFVPPATGADNEADFTGITPIRELFISEVKHMSFIAVDEEGTEAAAATSIEFGIISGGLSPPPSFVVDRPFLFWIEHTPTGTPLFLGQVTNPNAG